MSSGYIIHLVCDSELFAFLSRFVFYKFSFFEITLKIVSNDYII